MHRAKPEVPASAASTPWQGTFLECEVAPFGLTIHSAVGYFHVRTLGYKCSECSRAYRKEWLNSHVPSNESNSTRKLLLLITTTKIISVIATVTFVAERFELF